MDKEKLILELIEKTSISYEEAREALENTDWDILEAIVYLEKIGRISGSGNGEFYTNKYYKSYEASNNILNLNKDEENQEKFKSSKKNEREGNKFFEWICNIIDIGNNTWIEFSKDKNEILKIPITVLVVLTFFMFGTMIPLVIIALFLGVEAKVSSQKLNVEETNKYLSKLSEEIRNVKEKFKKEFKKHD
ncbi:MAG: DUF4342 domain-containing protein [Sarcina sp.]